ncbi:MAG: NAD-dependent epimerase/dehydratase family protein [Chloroflexaceae bacterium]
MATQALHVVLGAGPLGRATARALCQRGHRVRIVSRSRAKEVPLACEVDRADLNDASAVREVVQGAAVVYQCAQPPYHLWTTQFPALQQAIIQGVAHIGAKLIVAENLYMYGAVQGPIHEGLPAQAHTRKGRVRARLAEEVAEAHQSGLLRTAAARGSNFFGPGVRHSTLGDGVFLPALQGKPAQAIGRLDVPHSYTYIEDFGETMAILGERDEALGRHWHVPTAPAMTQRELIGMIYHELGAEPQMRGMGRLMMMAGALFLRDAREMLEMLYEFEQPFVVNSTRFERAFQVAPTPLHEAIRHTVAWYRANQNAAHAVAA